MSDPNPELTFVQRWWAMSYEDLAEDFSNREPPGKTRFERQAAVLQARLALEQAKTASETSKTAAWTRRLASIAVATLTVSAFSTGVAAWTGWEDRQANRQTISLTENDQCWQDVMATTSLLDLAGQAATEALATDIMQRLLTCRRNASLPGGP